MNTTVKKLKVLKLIILTLVAAGILLALTACGSADSLEFKLIMDEYYVVTDVKEDYPQKNRRAVQIRRTAREGNRLLCVCELQKFKKRRTPEQHPIYKHKSFLQLRIA